MESKENVRIEKQGKGKEGRGEKRNYSEKAWKRWEKNRKEIKAGRGWKNEQREEEIHLENIWKKVEEDGGRNLKSTEVRKGSTETPKKY